MSVDFSPFSAFDLSTWQQGQVLELDITDLTDQGEGVGRWQGRVVFVPNVVTGDRVTVRLIRVKPQYAYGKLERIVVPSAHRQRPACIVADKCGGCQWQHIDYEFQLQAKRNLVIQALERIGGFTHPVVEPVLSIGDPLHYRNKVTYPLQLTHHGQVQAGYYQKGSHQLINLNQCPIQDSRLDPLLAEIKQDIQKQHWPIYDERRHQGELRHLSFRIGRRTGEILLTLVARSGHLHGLASQAENWLKRYPQLVGITLNLNPARTNTIFGSSTRLVAGQDYLTETFAGLQFRIHPTTFFQVFTEQAEALLDMISNELRFQGHEVLVDAYCGVGTLILPLARHVQTAYGIEIQPEAVAQARCNALANRITNAEFQIGSVEDRLQMLSLQPDIVILDPPRKGCSDRVLQALQTLHPATIVYVSCNPATLSRDLKILCSTQTYSIRKIQPADFFPQTAHVETVVFLKLRGTD